MKRQNYWGIENDIVEKAAQHTLLREGLFILPALTAEVTLLDVGCGPGAISLDFAQHLPKGQFVGIDIDDYQIALANLEKDRMQLSNVDFQVADAYNLPFDSESFEVIFINNLFLHLQKPKEVLQELYRVCKTGGTIGIREGVGSFDHSCFLKLPDGFPNLSNFFEQAIKQTGVSPDIGLHIKGLLLQQGFLEPEIKVYSEVYDQPKDFMMLKDWYQSHLRGEFGNILLKSGFLTRKKLTTLVDSMDTWYQDKDALTVITWITYLAQKQTNL